MPRSARIHAPGHVFHIISRCMNREYLLEGPDARKRYLGLLAKGLRQTDASVLAWCLMSNHVHLVVRSGDDPLWRLLKRVHVGYAVWRNRRSRRLGPVFADSKRSPGVRLVGVLYAASATFEMLASGRSEGAAVPLSLASTAAVT